MSWRLPIYQSVALSEFLQQTLLRLAPLSACLNGIDGKTLWVEANEPSDLATLPAMAQSCQQYFNLSDGEIVICNDPYTGGTDLSRVTLVTGVGAMGGAKADFVLAARLALEPLWIESGKLSDEGVRIPPTPAGTVSSANWDLLAMIGSQPRIPRDFDSKIRGLIESVAQVHVRLQRALNEKHGVFHKTCAKDFLSDSTKAFRKQISHLALGETFASTRLESGELVKLRLKVHDDKILFDFSGTDASAAVNLTELMTFSACYNAVRTVLAHPAVCNSGAFESIIVSAPAKTLLNAKAPAGTWRGLHEGFQELSEFLITHLRRLNKIQTQPAVSAHPGFLELSFGDGGGFFYTLANGSNANSSESSALCPPAWQLSAEQIESKFPVVVKQLGQLRSTGQSGVVTGGDRVQLTLETKIPLSARWNFSAAKDAADLAGSFTKIDTARANLLQNPKGEISLAAGETLTATSAAGRGFGDVKVEDDES